MRFFKFFLLPALFLLILSFPLAAQEYYYPEEKPMPQNQLLDFSPQTIYFLMVDRFFNGNPDNNQPPELFSPDHSNLNLYQGGDLPGLIKKLDYLKQLGITAIWITPVVINSQDLYHYGSKTIASYHGYWGMDFWDVNRQFGNIDDFKQLIAECHKRKLKLILDIVLNHTSPIGQGCDGALYWQRRFVADYSHDPENWFHHNGPVNFSDQSETNWETRNLFDLADFNQDNPAVDFYLKEAAKFWLNLGLDGFRIDTARYLSPNWLNTLKTELLTLKPLFMFSEWSQGGPDMPPVVSFEKTSGIPILDFTLQKILPQL